MIRHELEKSDHEHLNHVRQSFSKACQRLVSFVHQSGYQMASFVIALTNELVG